MYIQLNIIMSEQKKKLLRSSEVLFNKKTFNYCLQEIAKSTNVFKIKINKCYNERITSDSERAKRVKFLSINKISIMV